MPVKIEDLGIDQLSVDDKLDLIEQIWDSLPEQVSPSEVPAWHVEVLEERLEEAEANPGGGIPFREALDSLLKQR
jgi:putative addiction module component (TIGR02574 family)